VETNSTALYHVRSLVSIGWRSSSSGARYSSQRPPVASQAVKSRIPPLLAVIADRDAQCLLLPGSIPGRFLIKLSRLRVARRIPHSATCFVTPWQPAIRSRRTWRREMPLHFRKYSHSCLNSSRLRSIDEERNEKPARGKPAQGKLRGKTSDGLT
jgi:hypothetical protein